MDLFPRKIKDHIPGQHSDDSQSYTDLLLREGQDCIETMIMDASSSQVNNRLQNQVHHSTSFKFGFQTADNHKEKDNKIHSTTNNQAAPQSGHNHPNESQFNNICGDQLALPDDYEELDHGKRGKIQINPNKSTPIQIENQSANLKFDFNKNEIRVNSIIHA
ncbi:hypothetical protein PGT21_022847 [Puccinia graminis f. sp. tritici]|nr:hypothetical protein PGT21_022847 [Puccinia graminis f. sp. tritici]